MKQKCILASERHLHNNKVNQNIISKFTTDWLIANTGLIINKTLTGVQGPIKDEIKNKIK